MITLVIVVMWDAYHQYDNNSKKYDPQQQHSSSKVSVTTTSDDRATSTGSTRLFGIQSSPEEGNDDVGG